jgi:hypothetical protein
MPGSAIIGRANVRGRQQYPSPACLGCKKRLPESDFVRSPQFVSDLGSGARITRETRRSVYEPSWDAPMASSSKVGFGENDLGGSAQADEVR